MLILNEKQFAEDLYLGKVTDVKSIVAKIGYVTRYHLHILNYNDEDNYKHTVEWANKNHNSFDESCYSNLISDAIARAHKTPFYNIDNIKITKNELEVISSLNNLRAEKVLFVLLCMAKQQSVSYGFSNGLVKYSLPELCKVARISVPTDDREYILYNIIQHGFLGYPKKNNTKCLLVNFIDNESEVVLELDEISCKELAYAYLNWKNNGNGYCKCELCERMIKRTKAHPKRFCKECEELVGEVPDGINAKRCDCGKIFYVDKRNQTKTKCDECQHEADKIYHREYMRNRRSC